MGTYVARSLLAPTGIVLLGLSLAFLTQSMTHWSNWVVNRGLGAEAVFLLAFYQIVPALAQVLPFSVLIGVLVALGNLRANNEVLALESLGVSGRHLWLPVAAFALAVTLLSSCLALWGAPAARQGQAHAMERLMASHPGATFTAGTVQSFGDHRILAREVSASGDTLRGVVLWSPELGETLFSEQAQVTPDGSGNIDLQLEDATMLLSPADGGGQIEVGGGV